MSGEYNQQESRVFLLKPVPRLVEAPGEVITIRTTGQPSSIAFQSDGKHIVGGGLDKTLHRWKVEDGHQVGSAMKAGCEVTSIVVSQDGRWIVHGTWGGSAIVWDTLTSKRVTEIKAHKEYVWAVDLSPVDTRVLATGSSDNAALIWDVDTGRRLVGPLQHSDTVAAIKFSPQGKHVATATYKSICVFDALTGDALLRIANLVDSTHSVSIAWSIDADHIFAVASPGKIKKFNANTGFLLTEWPVHRQTNFRSIIARANSGQFIAYAVNRFVSLWDTLMHTRLGPVIEHTHEIISIALSPDSCLLASAHKDGTVIILDLRDSIPQSYFSNPAHSGTSPLGRTDSRVSNAHHALSSGQIPYMYFDDATCTAWTQGKLGSAESMLTQEIVRSQTDDAKKARPSILNPLSKNTRVDEESQRRRLAHTLANRAIIRARSQQWVDANSDAEKASHQPSIEVQPLVIGFVAKSMVLFGTRKTEEGHQTFELVFTLCDRSDVNLLRLIKSILLHIAGDDKSALSSIGHLIAVNTQQQQADPRLAELIHFTRAQIYLCLAEAHIADGQKESAVQFFRQAQLPWDTRLSPDPRHTMISLISGWTLDGVNTRAQQGLCEVLSEAGRIREAVELLGNMIASFDEDYRPSQTTMEWIISFKQRCVRKLEKSGDDAMTLKKYDDANENYTAALSLQAKNIELLVKRSKVRALSGSWKGSLEDANEVIALDPSSPLGYQRKHAALHGSGRYDDAINVHQTMLAMLKHSTEPQSHAHSRQYADPLKTIATIRGVAESMCHILPHLLVDTRSGRILGKSQQSATFESSSTYKELVSSMTTQIDRPRIEQTIANYFRIVTISHTWDPGEALFYIANENRSIYNLNPSPANKRLQELCLRARDASANYANIVNAETLVLGIVEQSVCDLPRVLIDTSTGQLVDRAKQVALFRESEIYKELVSSMTAHVDRRKIEQAVARYYRYAVLSHKWDDLELLFQGVMGLSVYTLDPSPANDKLRHFCFHARDAGFFFAWADTCCIDRRDLVALQEALLSMFKWYRSSSLAIVHLQGVRSPSKRGDLAASVWNTRAWTYQEYIAAEVVQFYTEDWTPYLSLPIFDDNLQLVNHKADTAIIVEMEQVIRVMLGHHTWPWLRPGFDNVREKLCLASTRQATLIEDSAYSLLGMFSVAMPVMYGEGESALGRLLSHVLTGSGDASILAWTGRPSSYNTCFPAQITVFGQQETSHIPSPLNNEQLEAVVATFPTSISCDLLTTLYDQLSQLPPPVFVANRLKLPCITFPIGPLQSFHISPAYFYHAETIALGTVDIWTTEDLSGMNDLYLVHPWIRSLLSPDLLESGVQCADDLRGGRSTVGGQQSLHVAPAFPVAGRSKPVDERMRALKLLARLRRPFGALLLTQCPNGAGFKRVATDSLITVQLEEDVALEQLIANVRTLEVL